MRLIEAGDRAVLVHFGDEISDAARMRVASLTRRLLGAPGLVNVHPAYASVLIVFDPLRLKFADVAGLVAGGGESGEPEPRRVEIPVRYDGPDLEDVARHAGISPDEVIRLHSSAEYTVHFLGFAPGFPYLGGMPPALATPRLATPRKQVPAGSVAIGGSQTGVYSVASPGGWRIIGSTPLVLFDPRREPPTLLAMGDRVRFVPL